MSSLCTIGSCSCDLDDVACLTAVRGGENTAFIFTYIPIFAIAIPQCRSRCPDRIHPSSPHHLQSNFVLFDVTIRNFIHAPIVRACGEFGVRLSWSQNFGRAHAGRSLYLFAYRRFGSAKSTNASNSLRTKRDRSTNSPRHLRRCKAQNLCSIGVT